MKKCILFCAAEFDALAEPIAPGSCIIAADGGLRHTEKLGLTPDIVLGDFDSLGYTPKGANVFPVEKDDTDSMLAIRRGLALGYRDFLIYGGMDGSRVDHTVANFQALQFLADNNARGLLIGKDYIGTAIKNSSLCFDAGVNGGISVFCMGSDAHGVTLKGLYYPLTKGTLTAGFPLGVSNHFTASSAEISVEDGSLLILWERSAGLPRNENPEVTAC